MTFVSHLPTFDGTPRQLDRFITSVEEILTFIKDADQTPYGLLTLRAIRNKIIDRANEALELANTALVWDDIKNNLSRLYASKKSEACLLSELQAFSNNMSLGQLFFGISKIKSQLFSILKNSGQTTTVVEAKKVLYNEVCLNAFMSGLRDPLKTLIRLKSPNTIEQAYEQCQTEQALYYNRKFENIPGWRQNYNSTNNNHNNYNNNNYNNGRDNRKHPYSNFNSHRNSDSYNNRSDRRDYSNNNRNYDRQSNKPNPFKIENSQSQVLHNIEEEQQASAPPTGVNFQIPASGTQQAT